MLTDSLPSRGIRLYVNVPNAVVDPVTGAVSGQCTSVELEADPGPAGTVTGYFGVGANINEVSVQVTETGGLKRSTFNIPNPRRWNWENDFPEGYTIGLKGFTPA